MVDDDENLLQVTGDYLESRGHAITRCNDPMLAVETAKTLLPDLAIVDYEMPGLSGTHLVTALHQEPALSELPIIFLSGIDALTYASQVRPDPRIRFLHKPVKMKELDEMIADILE